ncbi:ROP [Hepatospora eriocheir]|uniref:ROP n=1 Tax=Hepatospora eriocheir TaxID=1081669 RepID=A0A1X0QCU3_9MICR|nr:ROP [Hepatospora eriocheir]
MNLKESLKTKIVKEVLTLYENTWFVLGYDFVGGSIISDFFKKSELVDYSIFTTFLIKMKKYQMDYPIVYFVENTPENYKTIKKEFDKKLFSKTIVVVIGDKEDSYFSNQTNLFKVIYFNCLIKPIEERIFINNNIQMIPKYLEELFKKGFNVFSSLNLKDHYDFNDSSFSVSGDLLILDRSFDYFTPLIHFLTYKSMLYEIDSNDDSLNEFKNDVLWPDLRYQHTANINNILKYHINKLTSNMEKLNKEGSIGELSKMVMDAPENSKIKESINRHSKSLQDCFTKLEKLQAKTSEDPYFKNLIESELILATNRRQGEKVSKFELSSIFEIFQNTSIAKDDKLRLLYLLKLKNLKFTATEMNILQQFGFKSEDINLKIDTSNQYKRKEFKQISKFEISRFEPFLRDIILEFLSDDHSFFSKNNNLSVKEKKDNVFSLRRTKMI